MAYKRTLLDRFFAVAVLFVMMLTAALSLNMPVFASAEDGNTTVISVSDSSVSSGANTSLNNPAATENNAAEEKSFDVFSFIFAFLVPVTAVITFLIFFIVTRAARLKKKRAEAKLQLSDTSEQNKTSKDK